MSAPLSSSLPYPTSQPPPPPPPSSTQHQAIDPHLQHPMYATDYPRPPHHPHPHATVGAPLSSRYQPYPAGLVHPPPPSARVDGPQPHSNEQSPEDQGQGAGRVLSTSKRAEQNRKAQRAFRERREQHVKQLESRSQLLDAALASADAANRRYEEARAMVEQLRSENTALRTALQAASGGSGSAAAAAIPPASTVQLGKLSPPRESKVNGSSATAAGSPRSQQPVSDARSEGRGGSRGSHDEVAEQMDEP
ncbi:hypothetical protein DACRYDRAFT_114753 [Dacryopinax primogenitus]|uniref:BZIP domain-containing protein n=1 Tax=Dacryopinax primogenitus (strain DJM 731) TaxID=1858805 RepID=M5G8E2_DACPD|nr:uncharacterized protein DACRYDRAFT_114753 [Dacryopinax primogenitus]EJU04425.1 hypothetical protein DACRYDRAFT_114753 [Dacryopinax primogenitus]